MTARHHAQIFHLWRKGLLKDKSPTVFLKENILRPLRQFLDLAGFFLMAVLGLLALFVSLHALFPDNVSWALTFAALFISTVLTGTLFAVGCISILKGTQRAPNPKIIPYVMGAGFFFYPAAVFVVYGTLWPELTLTSSLQSALWAWAFLLIGLVFFALGSLSWKLPQKLNTLKQEGFAQMSAHQKMKYAHLAKTSKPTS